MYEKRLKQELWELVKIEPSRTVREFASEMKKNNFDVSFWLACFNLLILLILLNSIGSLELGSKNVSTVGMLPFFPCWKNRMLL